ncbi:hypothetical protein [Muriicola marianensis]|uniref:Membrane protein n=1 Tax=Muriicola marianensis TaxID=1324801 RepID=A0ABQ1R0C5_9FLAO|nr:hypothetical protein [Muriicola marianensis]GGD53690.1 membrane protein [Muriicola marianensis]
MIRKIGFAILCLTAMGLYGQNGTVSPYSYFGIGDLRSGSTIENRMMGGLSLYTDSIHLTLKNPAGYGKLRLTTYTAGMSHREISLNSFTEQEKTSVTNLEYLAIGFPISPKISAGFGLRPFSSVGYDVLQERTNTNGNEETNLYSGEGGINQVFFSLGFELARNLNLGASVNYNFGTLENTKTQRVEGLQYGTQETQISDVGGYDFVYGLTFTPRIKDKYTLFTSAVINTQVNLISENTQTINSFSLSTGNTIEELEVNLAQQGLKNTELKIPTIATFGLGFGEDKKWFLGAEYSFQQLSTFENRFLRIQNQEYTDASSYAMGAFYIPDYTSFNSYFKRVIYRAGVRYDFTGIVVNGKEIQNFGITFGLGLPLGGSFSNLNLGFEWGKRGTTAADLIEEKYFGVNVGVSFNDRWFQKRKIN